MILLAAQIEGLASRKDKTVRLTLGTQELSPNKAAEIFQLNQKFCYVAIKEENFQAEEVDEIENLQAELETKKTPSQRLRGILFVNYQQNSEGYKDFATYYLAKMDKICNHFKNKLE